MDVYDTVVIEISKWGIWRSFNTSSDIIFGVISGLCILFILYMLYDMVKPTCCTCKKCFWAYQGRTVVVGGSGPESVESAFYCDTCYSKNNSKE